MQNFRWKVVDYVIYPQTLCADTRITNLTLNFIAHYTAVCICTLFTLHKLRVSHIRSVMGPLQMVEKTPCWMANDAEGQETQRDDLSFQGPTALFAIQQGVFLYPASVRILQRAHCFYIILDVILWSLLATSFLPKSLRTLDSRTTE